MATTKERMLVTLTPSVAKYIRTISKKEKTPRATIAARILEAKLEEWKVKNITQRERLALTKVLEKYDLHNAKYLAAKEFWKRLNKRRASANLA